MTRIVKVWGERNTGTRAMVALLQQLPDVSQRIAPRSDVPPYDAAVQAAVETQLNGPWKRLYLHAMRDDIAARTADTDPWKHALPRLTTPMVQAGLATLLMVRNPYSWLISLARRPYHIKGPNAATLEGFAARPWMTEAREGMDAVLTSPLALWSQKTAAALGFQGQARGAGLSSEIVRFEDFVQAPETCAARAFAALGLPATGALAAGAENTKPDEAPLSVLQRYYRDEIWRERLTAETVCRVNAQVDWVSAEALGYAQLDPAAFPDRLPPVIAAQMRDEMSSLGAPSHREACPATAT